MTTIPVIVSACFRLDADVMLIRLRQACVSRRKLCALSLRRLRPNTVACWLRIDPDPAAYIGQDAILQAGSLWPKLAVGSGASALNDLLTGAGIDRSSAGILANKLEQRHVLLGVLATSEEEVAIAWHIFKHVSADLIVIGTTIPKWKTLPAVREDARSIFKTTMPYGKDSWRCRWTGTVVGEPR
jgi:hypothetical protein